MIFFSSGHRFTWTDYRCLLNLTSVFFQWVSIDGYLLSMRRICLFLCISCNLFLIWIVDILDNLWVMLDSYSLWAIYFCLFNNLQRANPWSLCPLQFMVLDVSTQYFFLVFMFKHGFPGLLSLYIWLSVNCCSKIVPNPQILSNLKRLLVDLSQTGQQF